MLTEFARILAVDADPRLRDLYKRLLKQHGCSVVVAEGTESMNRALLEQCFDLMILDVMLPDARGFQILSRLRLKNDTLPVIVVTALGDDADRIIGLENGADDYLPKPFNPRELLARIHAILRRSRRKEVPGGPGVDGEILKFGSLTLDLSKRSLVRDGVPIPITTTDFATLKAFARYPNQALSRERLMQLSRGRNYEPSDRSLDVQISRLRKIIESDPQTPKYLQSVWGVGYVLIPDVVVKEAHEESSASTSMGP